MVAAGHAPEFLSWSASMPARHSTRAALLHCPVQSHAPSRELSPQLTTSAGLRVFFIIAFHLGTTVASVRVVQTSTAG